MTSHVTDALLIWLEPSSGLRALTTGRLARDGADRTGDADEIRTLLLAGNSGTRRIRPSRIGGGGRRLCRCRARRRRDGCDDADDADINRNTALRAAVPEGRQARDRADREHPVLSRRPSRACAEGGRRAAVGAPTSAYRRRFRAGNSRYPSSARVRPVLREPEGTGETADGGVLEGAGCEISGLFRGGAARRRRRLPDGAADHLRRSLAVPDRGRPALRLSEPHGRIRARDSGPDRPARARRGAAEHQD